MLGFISRVVEWYRKDKETQAITKRVVALGRAGDVLHRDYEELRARYDDTDPDSYATRAEYRLEIDELGQLTQGINKAMTSGVLDWRRVVTYVPEWEDEERAEAAATLFPYEPERVRVQRLYESNMERYKALIADLEGEGGVVVLTGFTAELDERAYELAW